MSTDTPLFMLPVPQNIEEAIDKINTILADGPDTGVKFFTEHDEDEFVVLLHSNLGQHIRNYWGLWARDTALYKQLTATYMLTHADDLSSLLTRAAYQTFHNRPIDVNKHVTRCHNHWAKFNEETS